MTTREKLFAGIMAAAVIGGGIHFTASAGADDIELPATPGPDLSVLVSEVHIGLRETELTTRERYLLNSASGIWGEDPFRSRALAPIEEIVEAPPEIAILPVYSAFINVGQRSLAIIDGQEYRINQSLNSGEYRLVGIFSDHVELIRQGASEPVLIPLAEEQQPN